MSATATRWPSLRQLPFAYRAWGAAGIALGAALTAALSFGLMPGRLLPRLALLSAYATLMLGVCLLACVVPVRRALGIEPTQAMRTEG